MGWNPSGKYLVNKQKTLHLILPICIFILMNAVCPGFGSDRYENLNKNFSHKDRDVRFIEKRLCKKFSIYSEQPTMNKLNKYQFRRSDHSHPQITRFHIGRK